MPHHFAVSPVSSRSLDRWPYSSAVSAAQNPPSLRFSSTSQIPLVYQIPPTDPTHSLWHGKFVRCCTVSPYCRLKVPSSRVPCGYEGVGPDTAQQLPRPVSRRDLVVARGCVKQCSCRFTHFAASAVPQRPWCGPSNPAARPDGSIPKDQHRPLPPPGCLRIRLRIPPSLTGRNIGACRSPVRPAEHAPPRADLEC